MKTAGRENPNRWVYASSKRAPGADSQNTSCSSKWAAKQEKVRPVQKCFFLTSTFIELTSHLKPCQQCWNISPRAGVNSLYEHQVAPSRSVSLRDGSRANRLVRTKATGGPS